MHRVFQTFIDRLAESVDLKDLHKAMADAAAALDLTCFAYLSMPYRRGGDAQVISTYPSAWTGHYVESHYECVDPVILRAARVSEPFEWGHDVGLNEFTKRQEQFFDEAAGFGAGRSPRSPSPPTCGTRRSAGASRRTPRSCNSWRCTSTPMLNDRGLPPEPSKRFAVESLPRPA